MNMAKQVMKRIGRTHIKPRNDAPVVPEIQGSAKYGKEKANLIIEGVSGTAQKVYHDKPHSKEK